MENPRSSCAIEVKDTRGKNYLPFSEVTDEQLQYALAVRSEKGVLIRVQGLNGEPDYVYLRSEPSYIIIKYPKCFVGISPELFIEERTVSKKKSLTASRAKDIATFVVQLSPP